MSGGVGHVPGCQCIECKPTISEPPLGLDEYWEVTLKLKLTIKAPDFYTARQQADGIAQSFEGAAAVVDGVTRKKTSMPPGSR